MTDDEAYAAMFYFLEQYWEQVKGADDNGILAGLLSDMSLLQDGTTADPAARQNWNEAVDFALKGGKATHLILGAKK